MLRPPVAPVRQQQQKAASAFTEAAWNCGLRGHGLLGDLVVCGVYYYAKSAACISGSPPKQEVSALHNYTGFPTLNIAISLSGTGNLPRLSAGGIPIASASSFSVGSARR